MSYNINESCSKPAVHLYQSLIKNEIKEIEGRITFELIKLTLPVNEKNPIGSLIGEWVGKWMRHKGIFFRNNENTQIPPDYYLGKDNQSNFLEVKCFDYNKAPNFDVAQFDAFTRDLIEHPYRLDADYLIFGYELKDGTLRIKDLWLKKLWDITKPSKEWPINVNVKQGIIHNIRPYNFKSMSKGFKPFRTRIEAAKAISETLKKYPNRRTRNPNSWLSKLKRAYFSSCGQEL
jgi:type II restriction enzyme